MALGSDELNDLAKRAVATFDALSPEEQIEHRIQQTISWVYGEQCLKYGDEFVDRAEIEKLIRRERANGT